MIDCNQQALEIFGATEVGSIASRRTARDEAWTPYPGVVMELRDGATGNGIVEIWVPLKG